MSSKVAVSVKLINDRMMFEGEVRTSFEIASA